MQPPKGGIRVMAWKTEYYVELYESDSNCANRETSNETADKQALNLTD